MSSFLANFRLNTVRLPRTSIWKSAEPTAEPVFIGVWDFEDLQSKRRRKEKFNRNRKEKRETSLPEVFGTLYPACEGSALLAVNAAVLNGWQPQKSPCCAGASLAGAVNAVRPRRKFCQSL